MSDRHERPDKLPYEALEKISSYNIRVNKRISILQNSRIDSHNRKHYDHLYGKQDGNGKTIGDYGTAPFGQGVPMGQAADNGLFKTLCH